MREFCVHAVTRFARFAMANPVRQHNEKFCYIERLIFSEKLASEFGANKLRAAAGCSVHDENRIGRFALRVLLGFSQRAIVNPQFRQSFARLKFEVANREIAFGRRGIICGQHETRGRDGQQSCKNSEG